MECEEILLTAEYVWFFWSDPPNNAHNHFEISVPSGTFNTEVYADQRELYHTCLQRPVWERVEVLEAENS